MLHLKIKKFPPKNARCASNIEHASDFFFDTHTQQEIILHLLVSLNFESPTLNFQTIQPKLFTSQGL